MNAFPNGLELWFFFLFFCQFSGSEILRIECIGYKRDLLAWLTLFVLCSNSYLHEVIIQFMWLQVPSLMMRSRRSPSESWVFSLCEKVKEAGFWYQWNTSAETSTEQKHSSAESKGRQAKWHLFSQTSLHSEIPLWTYPEAFFLVDSRAKQVAVQD